MRLRRRLLVALLTIAVFTTISATTATADPELIQCDDQRHVWHSWQCDRFDIGHNVPYGGGGDNRGLLGRILGGLTGGLL